VQATWALVSYDRDRLMPKILENIWICYEFTLSKRPRVLYGDLSYCLLYALISIVRVLCGQTKKDRHMFQALVLYLSRLQQSVCKDLPARLSGRFTFMIS
jgi:hypothetical protein